MSVTQTMQAPETLPEFEAIKAELVDTAGRPVVSEYCARCHCRHFTIEPHLDEIPCPRCGSTVKRCWRPSGHEADGWHVERIGLFDAVRDEKEAAGIPQVARWKPSSEEGV